MQFIAMQQDANCCGQPFAAYPVGQAAFSGGDPSICSPDSGGLATGIAPGQAGLYGGWSADRWIAWNILGAITCEYSPEDVLRDVLCNIASPEVSLTNAELYQMTAEFAGLSFGGKVATFNAGSSSHANDICGDDPQEFTITVNFALPPGGQLVASRCKATPESIPDQNYNVGTPTCVMDDTANRLGHMSIPARRRCCGGPDNHPGIRFVIGANKAGQTGTIDTPGSVRVLCQQ